MRHGKAAANAPEGDLARPLTERGRSDAHAVGDALWKAGARPARVLVSPAARTLETLEALPDALIRGARIERVGELYNGSAETILDAVEREAAGSDAAERDAGGGDVLVIGHNPGVSAALMNLAPDAARAMRPGDAAIVARDTGETHYIAAAAITGRA